MYFFPVKFIKIFKSFVNLSYHAFQVKQKGIGMGIVILNDGQ